MGRKQNKIKLVASIPAPLHRKLKADAAMFGASMSKYIQLIIESFYAKERKE